MRGGADWHSELEAAARKAAARVVGVSRITEVWHGKLLTTALAAFGDEPRATFHVEVLSSAGNIPRPDLILAHPAVGVVVIENKGLAPADIHGVQGTTLQVVRAGRLKDEDPFQQAERVMYRLKDLVGMRADLSQVLFLRTAALPRIGRHEFGRLFDVKWPDETLFAEECSDPAALRQHLMGYAAHQGRVAKKAALLGKWAGDAVTTVLGGTGVFFAPRRRQVQGADPQLLGVQVQQLELALKEPTEQQKTTGRADLRGNHRLFRGVAGSGKSIMLALSVATTLTKFREEADTLFGAASRRRTLVVCFNKTLVPYLRRKIEDRFARVAWDKPSSSELTVVHFEGLVRQLEAASPSLRTGLNFHDRQERARQIVERLTSLAGDAREGLLYDAVYVDEAQDLGPDEIRLLRLLSRADPATKGQSLLIFYDNAQNIYGSPTPVWQDLGVNIVGRTEFLDTCLRNTRQTLDFAFNVLVGSHAIEGQRVATRQFADVASLRQRGLAEEKGGRFETKFAPRLGPVPQVNAYQNRHAEIAGVAETVRKLIHEQRVLPSDILVLYQSHLSYKDALPSALASALGAAGRIRLIDRDHESNKDLLLLDDGTLTASTIASAKGYDAPVVLLLGADALEPDLVKDRATFYVGATRAKLLLHVSGVRAARPTLLDEAIESAKALDPTAVLLHARTTTPASPEPPPRPSPSCRHCGGTRLHAQDGRFGFHFVCIDCAEDTPMDRTCPVCGKPAVIRKSALDFLRDCDACKSSTLVHKNVPLSSLRVESRP